MPTKISCNMCWKLTAVHHNIIKLYVHMDKTEVHMELTALCLTYKYNNSIK